VAANARQRNFLEESMANNNPSIKLTRGTGAGIDQYFHLYSFSSELMEHPHVDGFDPMFLDRKTPPGGVARNIPCTHRNSHKLQGRWNRAILALHLRPTR
jgi:hypothetical protein